MSTAPRRLFALFLFCTVVAAGVWALLRFKAPRWRAQPTSTLANSSRNTSFDSWEDAVAKVKEDRGESANQGGIEVPTQLRHYEDPHWFLATQVAEVKKYNVQTSQDFIDLASMIERGELVPLPALTDTYILFGVGATADDHRFSRYQDDQSVDLYAESELSDAYTRLESTRANLQSRIANLETQLSATKKRDRAKQRDLQKEITALQQELKAADDQKTALDHFYGVAGSREQLFKDYESLQRLARDFAGRSYNLDEPGDRQALKVNLLRSLRPQALSVLEELADAYHSKFDRRLPVSSLVRPEQYQHALRRVNRNAVLIETPPHSTGLAFDIDYRYMGAPEQAFVMTELARLKDLGRIEVLRERSANYHVFAFVNGARPSDDLIAASLDNASDPAREANHAAKDVAKAKSKSQKSKKAPSKPKPRRRR
jgi:Family of unknown function (DUF5715)